MNKSIVGVAYSINDHAGRGMAFYFRRLLEENPLPNVVLKGYNESVLYFDFLEETQPSNFYLILSKHSSSKGIPSLTVHHTGNLTKEAIMGGKPEELSMSFPRLAAYLLKLIWMRYNEANNGSKVFEVSYEATHHGPTNITEPLVFLEIGSSINEWKNKYIQRFMGKIAYEALSSLVLGKLPSCTRAVGFGGGHYARRFTKLSLEKSICFGHIVPKYVLKKGISENVLKQVFDKNYEGITKVFFEKKSARKDIREFIRKKTLSRGLDFTFI